MLFASFLALCSSAGNGVVRVGYCPEPGMMNGAEPGAVKSGYAYEYLQEIASRAGWKCEYVYGDFKAVFTKLERGEIDILPFVNDTSERRRTLLYPDLPMGDDRIYIASTGARLPGNDLAGLAGRKVGTEKGSYDEKRFLELIAKLGIRCEVVGFATVAERWDGIKAGKVDFTVEMSSMMQDDALRAVYTLEGEHPYYIAVAPGRTKLLAELNRAQRELFEIDPGYVHKLRTRYFRRSPLFRTIPESGAKWLAAHRSIRIGTYDHQAPFIYSDDDGRIVGMAPDCVKLMFGELGVTNEVVWRIFGGRDEALAALRDGTIDLIHPYYHGYPDAEKDGVIISTAVYEAPFGILYRGDYTAETLSRVAAPSTRPGIRHLRDEYPNAECVPCRNGRECIEKLLSGEANSVVMYMPTLQAIAAEHEEDFNIKSLSTRCAICFAALPENAPLIGVINKAVPYIDSVRMNEIENRHAVVERTHFGFRDLLRQHLMAVYAASLLFFFAALVFVYLLMRTRRERALRRFAEKANRDLHERNGRMLALSGDFEALYDVELATGDYELFVKGQDFAKHVSSKLVEKREFFADAQRNIELAVMPEFRDDIRRFMDRDFILSALAREPHVDWHYQLEVDGKPVWYRMRITWKDGAKRNFLIGVFNAEAEMAAKEKERAESRSRALEEDKTRSEIVQDVLRSARWRFRVSADDRITGWEYSSDIAQLVKNEKAARSYEWSDLVHPDDLAATQTAFSASLKDHSCRTPYDVTFRMIDRDGRYNWFRSCGRMIRRADGSGDFLGIHIDVTERMEKDLAAAAKEQLLSGIARTIYGYTNAVDLTDGTFMPIAGMGMDEARSAMNEAANYREAYDRMMARIRPEYHDALRKLLSLDRLRCNQNARGLFGTEIYETRGEKPAWEEVTVIFTTGTNGHPIANILGRDITEARREAARVEREMKAVVAKDQIISGITLAMFGFDVTIDLRKDRFSLIKGSGTDLICNVFEACLDKSYTAAVDILLGHVPEAYRAQTLETIGRDVLLGRVQERGFLGTKQLPWHGSDGGDYWVELNSFMAANAAGEPVVNILGRDVTEERNHARALEQARQKVVGEMSHDVRNLLNALYGFTDLAQRHEHDPAKTEKYLSELEKYGHVVLEKVNAALGKDRLIEEVKSAKVENLHCPPPPDPSSSNAASRILLVEDNEINREVAVEMLLASGFEVETAVSGQEAVEKVKNSAYDLVLMDIQMPVMDGYEATRAIRAFEVEKRGGGGQRKVPIIALSANAFEEDRAASLAAGMNDHLPKPIKVKLLLETIRKYAGGGAMLEEMSVNNRESQVTAVDPESGGECSR